MNETRAFSNPAVNPATSLALISEIERLKKDLHAALVQIFGAEPEQLVLTSPDHFDITANFRDPCLVAGGPWAKLVHDLDARIAERKTYKDPGPRTAE